MSDIAEWTALARKILKTGHDIFATANVPITAKGYNDEKFLAMALLARTMSNFRGALLLLEHRRMIEGRVITRCCLENSYWIAGLVAEGEKFAREMLHDEIGHRQIRGQRLFASGLPLGDQVETRLRSWLRNSAKQFKNAKTLTPKEVALKTAIGKSYIFYEHFHLTPRILRWMRLTGTSSRTRKPKSAGSMLNLSCAIRNSPRPSNTFAWL